MQGYRKVAPSSDGSSKEAIWLLVTVWWCWGVAPALNNDSNDTVSYGWIASMMENSLEADC